MKRWIPLLCALLMFCLFPSPRLASAAEEKTYAVAASRDVWFYAHEDESSKLFLLPYTYYVAVTSEGEDFVAAEYLTDEPPYRKIHGYCRKDALTFVDFVPERPFLYREITASYTLPQESGLGEGKFSNIERTFVYYGHRYEGANLYFYVCFDGEFDYIPAEEELGFDLNTDYLEVAEPEKTGLSAAAIAAICVTCAAAVAAAVFVFRGKRPAPEPEHEF